MNNLTISINTDKGNATTDFLYNGKPIDGLFAINLLANTRSGEFIANGIRFKKDIYGRFYVDPKTNDTAMEGINLLALLQDGFSAIDKINEISKNLDKQLQDILDTSRLRARNLISERIGS